MIRLLRNFIEARLPLIAAVKRFLLEPQPPNVGWFHSLGSALLFLIVLQLITGSVLMLFYAPTPDHAWDSLTYLIENFSSGRILRGMHVWGTTLIIILMTLHLIRVVIHGAYKKPREINWISGVVVFLIILGFGFTGYLLPWDLKGYWATQVGTEMIGKVPLIGSFLMQMARGGPELGPYTLTRFYAIHVVFLPACLFLWVGIHIYLLRKHKIAPDPRQQSRSDSSRRLPFYPRQAFRDGMACLAFFGALLLLSQLAPPQLAPQADSLQVRYDPRPEWYFLAHYELLRFFPGSQLMSIVVIPSLIIMALLLLPFLDRSPERNWKRRRIYVVGVCALFFLLYLTAGYSRIYNPGELAETESNDQSSLQAAVSALQEKGRRVFETQKCLHCHRIAGTGGKLGPDLTQAGQLARETLRRQILDPISFNPESKMPPYEGRIPEQDLTALLEYLSRLK